MANDLGSLQRELGLSDDAMRKLVKTINDASDDTSKLTGKVGKLTAGFSQLGTIVASVGSALGLGLSLKELEQSVTKNNKTLYDLSRNTKIVGGNFKDLKANIEVLNTTTLMSRQQAAEFALTLQKNIVGIRMTGSEILKVGQVMSSEWGGSIEEINASTQKLISLQNKNVTFFKDISSSMSDAAFQDYIYTLEDVYGATKDQVEEAIRYRQALKGTGSATDEEAKKLRELSDTQQKAAKSAQDLQLAAGKGLEEQFKKTNEVIAKMNDTLKSLVDGFPGLVAAAGYAALAFTGLTSAMGAYTTARSALSLMGGTAAAGTAAAGTAAAGTAAAGTAAAGTAAAGTAAAGTAAAGTAAAGTAAAGTAAAAGTSAAAAGGAIVYGGIVVLKGIETALSEEKSRAQDLVLTQRGFFENIVNMFDPRELGPSIGAAVRGFFEDAPLQRTGGSGLDEKAYGKSVTSGRDEKLRQRKEAYEKWKEGGMKGQFKDQDPMRDKKKDQADATKQKEKEKNKVLEEERSKREEIKALLNQQSAISEKILSANKSQLDYLLRYKNDLSGASAVIKEMQDTSEADLKLAEKLLEMTMATGGARLKAARAMMEEAMAMGEGLEKDKKIAQAEKDINEEVSKRAMGLQRIAEAKKKIAELGTEEIRALEVGKETEQSKMAIVEAELNLSKNLYMGLGPTIDAQNKVLDSIEAQKNIIQLQLDKWNQLTDEQKKYPANIQLHNKLYLEGVNLKAKELELTKNLREGYLDAMGAFTNVSGAFSKIITTQEQSAGTAIKLFKAASSMRKGGIGGYVDPVMQFSRSGQPILGGDDGSVGGRREAAEWVNPNERLRATQMSNLGGMPESARETELGKAGQAALGQSTDLKGAVNNNTKAIEDMGTKAKPLHVIVDGGGTGTGTGALTGAAGTIPGTASVRTKDLGRTAQQQKAEIEAKMTNEEREAIKKSKEKEKTGQPKKEIEATDPASKAKARFKTAEKQLADAIVQDEKAKQQAITQKKAAMQAEISKGHKYIYDQKEVVSAYDEMGKAGTSAENIRKKVKSLDFFKAKFETDISDQKKQEGTLRGSAKKSGEFAAQFEKEGKTESAKSHRAEQVRYEKQANEVLKDRQVRETYLARMQKESTAAKGRLIIAEQKHDETSKKVTEAKNAAEVKFNKLKEDIKGPITVDAGPSKTKAAEEELRNANADLMGVMRDELDKKSRTGITAGKGTDSAYAYQSQEEKKFLADKANAKFLADTMANLGKTVQDNTKQGQQETINLGKYSKSTEAAVKTAGIYYSTPNEETPGTLGGATGGFVPGTGNKDSVPALLMPGEFVLNKQATKKYGWLMDSLNKNRFAAGGLVGGGLSGGAALDAGGGGGGSPRFAINIKGDSAGKISKAVMDKVHGQLNKLLMPSGSTGRMFDQTNNG